MHCQECNISGSCDNNTPHEKTERNANSGRQRVWAPDRLAYAIRPQCVVASRLPLHSSLDLLCLEAAVANGDLLACIVPGSEFEGRHNLGVA